MTNLYPSRLTFAGSLRPGNTVEVRWIAGHPMETGLRGDDVGRRIPRNIIVQGRVLLDGKLLFEFEPGTGLSANPYLAFGFTVPPQGGVLSVHWVDDNGQRGSVQHVLLLEK